MSIEINLSRRAFTKLLAAFPLFGTFGLLPAKKIEITTVQRGQVSGVFDQHGTIRLPLSFAFPEQPLVTVSPTGGYFSVSKFEAGALSAKEGYVSALGEPGAPCAFTWFAVG